MIAVTSQTTKSQLLRELSRRASQSEELTIRIDSLPDFISSKVSFSHFLYQIKNYPRPIKWESGSPKIRLHLKDLVKSIELTQQSSSLIVTQPLTVSQTQSAVVSPTNELVMYGAPVLAATDIVPPTKVEQKTQPVQAVATPEPVILSQNSTKAEPSQDMFQQLKEKSQQPQSSQDLDSWVNKIQATKAALDTIKLDNKTPTTIQTVSKSNIVQSRKNWMRIALAGGALAVFAFGFFAFPTEAYTLEVQNSIEESSQEVSIPLNDFSRKVSTFKADVQVEASGQANNDSARASGQIALINKGNRDVRLSNGGFRLLNNGNRYVHVRNSSLPETIIIPARNDRNGPTLEITIQADGLGTSYNVGPDTRFEIVNLLGQSPCSSCYGISTSDVQNSSTQGNRSVVEEDQSLLRTTAEGEIATQRQSVAQDLQDDQVFTNSEWYQNTDSSLQFSHEIGDRADDVNLNMQVTSTLYYLPGTLVKARLEELEPGIIVKEMSIISYEGEIADNEPLRLNIFYGFIRPSQLNEDQLSQTLSEQDFETAKSEIQGQFPQVKNIRKEERGINIPGIPRRVNIEVIEQGQS